MASELSHSASPIPASQAYGATGSILRRNLRAAIVHPNDADSALLADHLQRMGIKTRAIWPPPALPPEGAELIFLSWRAESTESSEFQGWVSRVPLVAVISYENPTFIDHALSLGCTAVVTTPIRASGLLSAVVLALHLHKRERQKTDRIDRLEKKLNGVRQMGEAKAILMRLHGVDEAHAYEMLRSQAMAKRVPIEEICVAVIQANDVFSTMTHRK